MEMIRAKVSGLYIFHAGEEHGGLGSAWIAKNRADLLLGYKAAIAFDRKGTDSIITHQGARTCSDRFAMSLSRELGGGFHCDPTGTFTDTANYEGIIGECTNVSVGYNNNHGPNETLDLLHVRELRDMLVQFNHAGLVYEREPGDEDYDTWDAVKDASYDRFQDYAHSRIGLYDEAIIQMVYDFPESAARLIEQLGGNTGDMLEQNSARRSQVAGLCVRSGSLNPSSGKPLNPAGETQPGFFVLCGRGPGWPGGRGPGRPVVCGRGCRSPLAGPCVEAQVARWSSPGCSSEAQAPWTPWCPAAVCGQDPVPWTPQDDAGCVEATG